jgi:hypothetical protein
MPLHIALTHTPLPNGEYARPELVDSLEGFGHRVTLIGDGLPAGEPVDVLWIDHNANWYPRLCRQLGELSGRAERPFVLLWHSEPLPLPAEAPFPRPHLHLRERAKVLLRDSRATDPYTNARRLQQLMQRRVIDLLVVSTPSRQAFLAERGICAPFVPLGYHTSHGRDLKRAQRDIDVLFLGALDVPRRRRLIAQLRSAGVRVEALGSWHRKDTWGEARTELLNRTKIFLNIQRYPGEMSGLRMILAMANKAMVISEPIYLPGPYRPGEHWAEAGIEQMPEVIAYYLQHEAERQRLVEAGHELVMNQITLERSAGAILELVASARKGAA